MLDSLDKQKLHKLLSDTIPLLCKNTLGCSLELSVEAFIGITLSSENASKEVVMVSFKETLQADGRVSSYVWSEVPSSSRGPPPPLVKPVAFTVSDSVKDKRYLPAVDCIDSNARGLDRHEECSQNWVDGRYWSKCDKPAANNIVPVQSRDGAKDTTGTLSCHPLSFAVKAEEYDDIAQAEDEPEEFETEADFENTCDTGSSRESPYTGVVPVCNYSPVPFSYRNANAYKYYVSATGRSLPNASQRPRKEISQSGAARSLPVKHLLAMNASVHPSHSEVCKIDT